MTDESKAKGGFARAEKLTPAQRSEIAKKAAEARWEASIPKATHSGILTIGDAEIPAYVLENGERVLSTRGIMKSLGRTWRGRKYPGTQLPVFLEANNLKPFISDEDDPVLKPVRFEVNTTPSARDIEQSYCTSFAIPTYRQEQTVSSSGRRRILQKSAKSCFAHFPRLA